MPATSLCGRGTWPDCVRSRGLRVAAPAEPEVDQSRTGPWARCGGSSTRRGVVGGRIGWTWKPRPSVDAAEDDSGRCSRPSNARTATVTLDFTSHAGGGRRKRRLPLLAGSGGSALLANASADDAGCVPRPARLRVNPPCIEARKAVFWQHSSRLVGLGESRCPPGCFRVTAPRGGLIIDILCEGFEWPIERPS